MRQFYSQSFFFLLIFISLSFSDLAAQDLTPEEIERKQLVRQQYIKKGFLQSVDPPTFSQSSSFLLTEAWFTGKSMNSVSVNSRANDISSDGTRFYVVGREDEHIVEYGLSEPWDISTAEYLRELDVSNELRATEDRESAPHGIYFRKNDGMKMWLMNRTEIWEYTLSDPWNVTSAEVTGRADLIDFVIRGHDIDFRPDGRVLYIDDRELQAVLQFNLEIPWDVATLNLDFVLDISEVEVEIRGTQFSSDGHKVFFMDTGREDVLEYNVANAFDLRSAVFVDAYNVATEALNPVNMTLSPDNNSFYITDNVEDIVLMYRISEVDTAESSIMLSETEVDADGSSYSKVSVTVRDKDRYRFPGVSVELLFNDSTPELEVINNITNEDGIAHFRLRNTKAEILNVKAITEKNERNYALIDNPEITFRPPSPVVLAASEVDKRNFVANWEAVNIATSYLLDVAEDDEFETIIENFSEFNVDNVTSYIIENLNPGGVYYYRVRALSNEIKGSYSETFEVYLFPDEPTVQMPTNVAATNFIANWSVADGASSYLLDVSTDDNFENIVYQIETEKNERITEHKVTELNPGTTYYYRVQSQTAIRESNFSGSATATTLIIDVEMSTISSSQLRILANGEQENDIIVVLKTPDGNPIQGETISVNPMNGNSKVNIIQNSTNEEGIAKFSVSNVTEEMVDYEVVVSDVFILGNISLEFIAADNQLTLGNNYPNPFQVKTIIPLTIPSRMNAKIVISNILGMDVKTILDEQLEAGYYEIPVSLDGLASGTYFYRLITDQSTKTRNMMLIN